MELKSRDIPSFGGAFHRFKIRISTNQEKGTQDYFIVLSQGRRHTFSKYLWYKFLFDNLSKEEEEIFFHLPEIINNPFKIQVLRACIKLGKKTIRKKLENFPLIPPNEKVSRKKYQGIHGNTRYDLSRRVGKLPKPPKFSGWIRNSSSKDRKSFSKGSVMDPLNLLLEDFVEEQNFDWFLYLTVGTVPTGPPGQIGYLFPDEANEQKQLITQCFVLESRKPPLHLRTEAGTRVYP